MTPENGLARADSREAILRRFEEWLDDTLAAEPPPSGLDAELLEEIDRDQASAREEYDAFAMWSAMTALTQEVKLQGRSFKDLAAVIGSQSPDAAVERVSAELRAAYRERERESQREAERRVRREVLEGLLDLRESLERGLRTVDSVPPLGGWRGRLVGDPTAETRQALRKGYLLTVERLDTLLAAWNVSAVGKAGDKFDPRVMNAVDIQETDSVPDGSVVEVYRAGYEWNGAVYRTAQVRVARAKGASN